VTQRVEYQTLELPTKGVRVFQTKRFTSAIEAVGGVTITRIIDGPVAFYRVEGPGVVNGAVEIPFDMAVGTPKPGPVLVAKGGKAKDAA
jgi:hypothetical protein